MAASVGPSVVVRGVTRASQARRGVAVGVRRGIVLKLSNHNIVVNLEHYNLGTATRRHIVTVPDI